MTKRPKLQKRKRMKRERVVPPEKLSVGRVFRVKPDPSAPFIVEIRIARDNRRMRGLMHVHDGKELAESTERECMGLVRTWHWKQSGTARVRPRQLVARVYLNERDLRARPSEIVAHECGHAAMGWARLKRAHLGAMEGEEVMCYALGRLVAQVNRVCYAHGVWP